jgi:cytochrome P450
MYDEHSRLALPVLRTDPDTVPETYTRLRSEQPVCPATMVTGDPAYLVTGHEDLKVVLSDERFSRGAMCAEDAPRCQAVRPHPDTILNMDAPRHTHVRKLAAEAFTPRAVEKKRPLIEQIADELLDQMAAMTPPADFIAAFSLPFPLRIICEILGIPFEDRVKFLETVDTIMTFNSSREDLGRGYIALRGYFLELIASKRRNPGDDFLTVLIGKCDEEGLLTESELLSLCTILMVAGHETSVTVITSAVLNLIRHPDQLAALRAEPALMPRAVEEMLRVGIPGISPYPRFATSDVELGDTVIPKGAAVVVNYETALRDPAIFDDPGRFDIRRQPISQVFFGHGPHFCLGSTISRVELEVGIKRIFDRFPNLALAAPVEELEWKDFATLGNFRRFPVTW